MLLIRQIQDLDLLVKVPGFYSKVYHYRPASSRLCRRFWELQMTLACHRVCLRGDLRLRDGHENYLPCPLCHRVYLPCPGLGLLLRPCCCRPRPCPPTSCSASRRPLSLSALAASRCSPPADSPCQRAAGPRPGHG